MRRLAKLLRLSGDERSLLVRSWLLLAMIRLGLWVLPFGKLRRWLEHRSKPRGEPVRSEAHTPERIVWAILVTSDYVPGVQTCLPRALAAHFLMVKHGYPAELRLGVAFDDQEFKAHAWVESDGEMVMGGADAKQFVLLQSPKSTER